MLTFSNIRISRRIYGGFSVVLALLLGLTVVSGTSLIASGTTFEKFEVLSFQTSRIGEIRAEMLEAQNTVQQYLSEPSETLAQAVAESGDKVLSRLAEVSSLSESDEERAALDAAESDLQAYLAAFQRLTALEAKRAELVAQAETVGIDMGAKMAELIRSAFEEYLADVAYLGGEVQSNILSMRLAVAAFALNPDDAAYTEAKAQSAQMVENREKLVEQVYDENRAALAEQVGGLREQYDALIVALYDTVQARRALVDQELNVLGSRLVDSMAHMNADITESQGVLGEEGQSTIESAIVLTAFVATLSIVLAALAAWVIGNGIAGPIRSITDAMTELAGGDRQTEIPGTERKDEIGAMAAAVQIFKENMQKADDLTAQQLEEARRREARGKKIEEGTQRFDAAVAELLNIFTSSATETEATSATMERLATETSERATAVSAAAEQATANVQGVAAAATEMSQTASEISRQVSQSSQIAARAVDQAQRTNQQMNGLSSAAQKIGEVVKLISDIAEQTNLLALNATIEAARAGDAGKGFAVVANEVKSLATQTAQATGEISQQVSEIQSETGAAVGEIETIAATIDEINQITAAIAAAMEEQSATTDEITRNVEQAAAGAQDVTANIVEVTRAASETGQAAGELTSVASDLNVRADELKRLVESFLSEVRAV